MTNKEIMKVAMEQSALESGCKAGDFLQKKNIIVKSVKNAGARKYLELPFICDFTSYGNNIVASVNADLWNIAEKYLNSYPTERMFETPVLHLLDDDIRPYGARVCFQSAYYLPDVNKLTGGSVKYELRVLNQDDFQELYTKEWSYALCQKRKELDVLGVGAYGKDGNLVGLAACSEDCEKMWQIGVDVLPDYQREGIASELTKRLAWEILGRDRVPFYRSPWCNIKSSRNAIKSGFRLSWCQMTVKEDKFVSQMVHEIADQKNKPGTRGK